MILSSGYVARKGMANAINRQIPEIRLELIVGSEFKVSAGERSIHAHVYVRE